MEDWQQRVVNEAIQLEDKITSLTNWLARNGEVTDIYDLRLLRAQLCAMQLYAELLQQRISRFEQI